MLSDRTAAQPVPCVHSCDIIAADVLCSDKQQEGDRNRELNGQKQHEREVSGQKPNGVRLTHMCQHHGDL